MMAHDYQSMPGKDIAGDNPRDTVMLMRCKWCNKTPIKAREDGCPVHELARVGWITLAHWNPDGMERFAGRKCVTCYGDIMAHWLRETDDPVMKATYWCTREGQQVSLGIEDAQWDVPEGFGQ